VTSARSQEERAVPPPADEVDRRARTLERAPARRRRSRTFRPDYLSFGATYQCNLTCAHCCVPIEWPDRLAIEPAVRFLEDAHAFGVRTLGFTGGEPFLYPEFLLAVTRRAAALGFRFDKVMTNGVWFTTAAELGRVLGDLAAAGFTGKLGLSVDKFHGLPVPRLAEFCRTARRVFDRDTVVSISYASRVPHQGLEPVARLAAELGGVVEWSAALGRFLLVSPDLTVTLNWNHLAPVERAASFSGGWDGAWFVEDYCEGPGQALVVNPKGEVKPCCGFASDLDRLTIGNIHTDTVAAVVRRARRHPYVGKVFREGLTAVRDEILARDPGALPGATSNHCFFCWYVLTQNLVALPNGSREPSPAGRMSLPLAGDGPTPTVARPAEFAAALVMAFDGKTVFLRRELSAEMPLDKGRVYLVNVTGPSPVEPPAGRMTWADYQAWIDRLRGGGYTLTAHAFSPCRK
jgi:pyruvate-formate lyase-activating enzyme